MKERKKERRTRGRGMEDKKEEDLKESERGSRRG